MRRNIALLFIFFFFLLSASAKIKPKQPFIFYGGAEGSWGTSLAAKTLKYEPVVSNGMMGMHGYLGYRFTPNYGAGVRLGMKAYDNPSLSGQTFALEGRHFFNQQRAVMSASVGTIVSGDSDLQSDVWFADCVVGYEFVRMGNVQLMTQVGAEVMRYTMTHLPSALTEIKSPVTRSSQRLSLFIRVGLCF